jgi:DNA gyrase subunit B
MLKAPALDLSDLKAAQKSAEALTKTLNDDSVSLRAEYNEATESSRILITRTYHGNLQVSALDKDFLDSGDYKQIAATAQLLQGLVGKGASVRRGEKETAVAEFKQALDWLMDDVQRNLQIQRYKGLGEMNPEQLWETTMDPKVRRLLKVQIEDAISADEIFSTLMGEAVEPRRAFIETNALVARNIDI